MAEIKFYTYLWLREDGTPYYVGKGTGKRGFKTLNHTVRCPKDKSFVITQEWPNEEDAFSAEEFLIIHYGRIDLGTGCLRNRTNGGEGQAGISEETRAKLSAAKIGKKQSPEQVAKRAKSLKGVAGRKAGYKLSEEDKRKLSEAMKGLVKSPETRAKLSKANSGKVRSEEAKKKHSKALKGKPWTEARREAQNRRLNGKRIT